MTMFFVRFSWPAEAHSKDQAEHELSAQTLDVAKLQAAMLYATLPFQAGCPSGFQIIEGGVAEVYRFPQTTIH